MRRCFLGAIDSTFDPHKDIAIGPWCFERATQAQQYEFYEPYDHNEVLEIHKKLFDFLRTYLYQKFIDNETYYYLYLKDFFYLGYFCFSRYRLLKKFFSQHTLEEISFELIESCNQEDIFYFCFNSEGIGFMLGEIIKAMYPDQKIFWFSKKNSKNSFNEVGGVASKKESIKSIGYFKNISGITFVKNLVLSSLYYVCSLKKHSRSQSRPCEHIMSISKDMEEFSNIIGYLDWFFLRRVPFQFLKKGPRLRIGFPSFYYASSDVVNYDFITKRSQVVLLQHGAVYATALNHFRRELEYVFTTFIAWGKETFSYTPRKNIINYLPSPHLSFIANSYAFKNQENFLWVTGIFYKGGDGCELIYGTQVLRYIENKKMFWDHLGSHTKKKLIYKHLAASTEQFHDEMLDILGDKATTEPNAIAHMKNSRLSFMDYYGTPFYEAMSMNVPTILALLETEPFFTDEAAKLFRKFEDVGVLYRDPESAAKAVNRIYNSDVESWWHQGKIQEVREEFLEKYANNKPYFWPWVKAIWKRAV